MAKEYWYFVSGVLVVVLPLLVLVAVKKLNLLDERPDKMIVYRTNGDQSLTLHAFMAKDTEGGQPAPALLLFHGGRWLFGGPRDLYPQCRFFAEQGITCFSAQYTLGRMSRPEVRSAVADARAALDYLVEHAGDLNLDPQRIAVGGGSSGGHLAAALGSGLPGAAANERRPAALVLYNPMLDLSPGTPDHHLVKHYWEEVSPHHHIDGDVPPALILVGSLDPEVPVPTAEAYCMAVRDAAGDCEVEVYEGESHGFFNKPRFRDATNQRILQFLSNLNGRAR
jgi:acetyl esterase/lipase